MIRSSLLIVVLALVVSACGYTRSEAVAVRDQSVARGSQQGAANPSAQADPEPGTDSGPPPTALAQAVEIPSKGAPDEIAASIEYQDGRQVEFTFAELDAIVQPSLANAQYRILGEVAPTFDAQIVNLLIFNQSIEEELRAAGVEVSEEDRAAAESALLSEVSLLLAAEAGDPAADREEAAEELFAEVPHLQLIVETRSRQEAAVGYFSSTSEPAEVPCVSHILTDSEQAASDLLPEIDSAESFAETAAERSTDEASSANGGFLACVSAEQFLEPTFVTAVEEATVGQVSGPVQTSLGWHLVLVTEFQPEEIEQGALAEREFNAAVEARVGAATITVDPAIGTWDAETSTMVPAAP